MDIAAERFQAGPRVRHEQRGARKADEYRVGHQRLHHSMQPAVLRTVALVHEDEDFTERLAGSRLQFLDELVELFVGLLGARWTKLVNQRAKEARFRLAELLHEVAAAARAHYGLAGACKDSLDLLI